MSKPLRAFKTVRSTMESVQDLLNRGTLNVRNFRLIHLIRDPRGQVNSVYTHHIPPKTKINILRLQKICLRQEKDLQIQRALRKMHPQSFLEIRYEDLAQRPHELVNEIYTFIQNSPAPREVTQWLRESTGSVNLTEERFFGTERRNSSATASAWHQELPEQVIKLIDRKCLNFYNVSGYYKPYYET